LSFANTVGGEGEIQRADAQICGVSKEDWAKMTAAETQLAIAKKDNEK
jgi:hypothetical protein